MDKSELMVGDYVCYNQANNYITRVREIRQTNDGKEWYITCTRDGNDNTNPLADDRFHLDILKPIPITNEILEKIGFVWDESPMIQYWTGYGLIIDQSGTLFYIRTLSTSMIIHSVHELQHIFKLCNINKEITL